jgi:carboxyl-terminal processing protease
MKLPALSVVILQLVLQPGSSWVTQHSDGRPALFAPLTSRQLGKNGYLLDAKPRVRIQSQKELFQSVGKQLSVALLAGGLILFPPRVDHSERIILPAFADELSILQFPRTTQESGTATVEETWDLVNKYYIDRTFGGQDWDQVRKKYLKSVAKVGNDETQVIKLVSSMVDSLKDKYSRVLDPAAYSAIQKYDLIGVGATLMPNENKDIIVGAPPIPGSAAARAGLQVGDTVLAINGVSNKGRNAFDIIDQISEKPDAPTVTMTVERKGSKSTEDLILPRQFAEVKNPIRYKISERRQDGTVVAYIKIMEFNGLVKAKLEEALRELEVAGANAYVLDLRQNTGGAFQSAVEISSLFMSDRVATYVVDSADVKLPFRTAADKLAIDKTDPLVVWIDGRTASASEVLAGSLHDNCRAVLMGSTSFGKGLIQAVYGLKNGAGLVLTVARYVTPNGTDIQGTGINPDLSDGVSLLLPGVVSDTSRVDFKEIKSRLDPSFCSVPER